jgi:hypothetical protein
MFTWQEFVGCGLHTLVPVQAPDWQIMQWFPLEVQDVPSPTAPPLQEYWLVSDPVTWQIWQRFVAVHGSIAGDWAVH